MKSGTVSIADMDIDDFKKINMMKKRLGNRMTELEEEPFNKVSIRGQKSREKHRELREERDNFQFVVDNFDTFQELLDNAATYGHTSTKALNTLLKRDIFISPEKAKAAAQ